jgi:hypothetical protein
MSEVELRYPEEDISADDDGTMVESKAELARAIVGHKITFVDTNAPIKGGYYGKTTGTILTLDNGRKVQIVGESDCCAFTEVENVVLHLDNIDHVITGIGTTDEYETWHIYADIGDVMTMKVGWSCGNPFYYGYGFSIKVQDVEPPKAVGYDNCMCTEESIVLGCSIHDARTRAPKELEA